MKLTNQPLLLSERVRAVADIWTDIEDPKCLDVVWNPYNDGFENQSELESINKELYEVIERKYFFTALQGVFGSTPPTHATAFDVGLHRVMFCIIITKGGTMVTGEYLAPKVPQESWLTELYAYANALSKLEQLSQEAV